MYKSHYIPQLVLRQFGNHFDIFDIKKQQISKGLTSAQGFFVLGLYDDDVESSLSKDMEVYFSVYLPKMKTSGSETERQEAIGFFRKFLILSFIRTPSFRDRCQRESWNDMLRGII